MVLSQTSLPLAPLHQAVVGCLVARPVPSARRVLQEQSRNIGSANTAAGHNHITWVLALLKLSAVYQDCCVRAWATFTLAD